MGDTILWAFVWLGINGVVGYLIGKQKNNISNCVVLSILLGPIGWLISLLEKGNVRKCPFCAEEIKPEAKVCRYCGRDLPETTPAGPAPSSLGKPSSDVPISGIIVLSLIIVVLIAVVIYARLHSEMQRTHDPTPTATATAGATN